MLPSPDILNEYPHGKFVLSNLAAKRANQLREGAPPLVQVEGSNHPLTIALAEIAAGKIKPVLTSGEDTLDTTTETALLIEETVPAELGMLLPALDETEAALVTSTAIVGEEEHEAELEPDETEPTSLSDLVDEEEEEAAAPADDDTLSLSDIAEQESADEEETED